MEHVALPENYESVGQGHLFLSTRPRDLESRISRVSGYGKYSRETANDFEEKQSQNRESQVKRFSRCQSSEGDMFSYHDRSRLRIVKDKPVSFQSRVRTGTCATFRLDSTYRDLRGVQRTPKTPDVGTREALGEYVENLFNEVRGEALLIAALAYGIEVSLDKLRALKVRDVRLSDGIVVVGRSECKLPAALVEDVQEQMRGHSESGECILPRSSMNRLFFSSEAFSQVETLLSRLESRYSSLFERYRSRTEDRCLNIRLKVLGWFHKRWASRIAGVHYKSALDLFDKGPRINRRRGRGAQDIYYVWRLSRIVSW